MLLTELLCLVPPVGNCGWVEVCCYKWLLLEDCLLYSLVKQCKFVSLVKTTFAIFQLMLQLVNVIWLTLGIDSNHDLFFAPSSFLFTDIFSPKSLISNRAIGSNCYKVYNSDGQMVFLQLLWEKCSLDNLRLGRFPEKV